MFRPAGSRLPWKSFQAGRCTSVVRRDAVESSQVTATLSLRVRAPAMVTAPAGRASGTASGAAATAPSATRISPARAARVRRKVTCTAALPVRPDGIRAYHATERRRQGRRRVNSLLQRSKHGAFGDAHGGRLHCGPCPTPPPPPPARPPPPRPAAPAPATAPARPPRRPPPP